MTFNAAIPQATDLISQSQSQIQTNFSQSNTAFGVDHTAFDVVSNQGKHKKSTYVEQSTPATAVNEIAVYSKDTGTQPDLFYRPESNGTEQRLTGGGLTAAAYCGFDGPGAGIFVQYNVGSVTRTGVGSYQVNFTRNFASASYAVQVLPSYNQGGTNKGVSVFLQTRAVGSLTFQTQANGVAFDPSEVHVLIFGTLA